MIPILLASLGRVEITRPAGRRFKAAIGTAWVLWILAGLALSPNGFRSALFDWIAGAAILVAASFAMFVVWSVIVWGFTLNLLLVISGSDRPLDCNSWMARYSGNSIDEIVMDRVAVLVNLGIARFDAADVVLRPGLGHFAVIITRVVRSIFGLARL
jgi:hypothetical protein